MRAKNSLRLQLRVRHRGFTLIELLIAIAIIGTLASIVVIAVNPTRQLASARDAKRSSDAVNLEKALYQYMIDKGSMPVTMPGDSSAAKEVCREGSTDPSCLDFDLLTPDYLAAIPLDATETNPLFTGYKAYQQVGRPRVVSTYLGTDGATTGGGAGPPIGTAGNPGASCLAILSGGGSVGNGSYWIDPDGSGGSAAFQAYCDMTTDGGGWTFVGHVNGDYIGSTFFTTPVGTYKLDRSDTNTTYSLGIMDELADTETMVTLDTPDPAPAITASKFIIYRYAANYAGFNNGPVPCVGLDSNFEFKLTIAGSYGAGSAACTGIYWFPLGPSYLTLFYEGVYGNYWGESMGGNNTWNHDGWWYVR